MTKVVHVLSDSNIGGAGIVVKTIADNIASDIKLYIVVPVGAEIIDRLPDRDNIEVIEANGIKDISYSKEGLIELKKIIREIDPDVVHTHSSLSGRIAAKRVSNAKVINTRHCVEPLSGGIIKKFIKKIVNNHYSDMVIAVSDSVRDNLIDSGMNTDKIVTIYNSVNKIKELDDEVVRAEKKRLDIEGKTVFGYMGRLAEVKNPLALVDIAKHLKSTRDDFVFLVAGEGALKEKLQTKVEKENLKEHFRILGQVSDLEKFYNVVDVLVNTSFSEALSLSILEAMSIGKPIVAFDVDTLYQVVKHKQNGFLVKTYDVREYSEKLLKLFDEDLRREFGAFSADLFDTAFSLHTFIEKISAIYRES